MEPTEGLKMAGVNRIPTATYRLQFHGGFTFQDAQRLVEYLHQLGITDLYASPIFCAGPESTHGYDICDFNQINPRLGSPDDLKRLSAQLREAGMGLLLDVVPNHMGAYPSNSWWMDVLRNGRHSKYAKYFDIDWESANPTLKGKVLLPVLGDRYASALERGELALKFEGDNFRIAYFDNHFPVSPESEFELRSQWEHSAHNAPALENLLGVYNGKPGDPSSFDRLNALIESQNYRLAFWRVGPQEINYRRFFDVTQLAAIRVEDPDVFEDVHGLVFELLRSGQISGLRIDHPDGLRDPKSYFDRLQTRFQEGQHERSTTQRNEHEPLYIVAEKILSDAEHLAEDWPVSGTTGYDYLNFLNGIFIDRDAERKFSEFYSKFAGVSEPFEEVALRSKRQVLATMFQSEVDGLTNRAEQIARKTRYGKDFTRRELSSAIVELIAAFPVYRTYVRSLDTREQPLSPEEVSWLESALSSACSAAPDLSTVLRFLYSLLRLDIPGDLEVSSHAEVLEFIARFQQLSGPATAKGLEDTAFYRFFRFISINEVGGNPGRFGVSIDEFHRYNQHKQQRWPHSLLASSTHDTKRGEDVRARLNVLSEIPDQWFTAVKEWRDLNAPFKTLVNNNPAPDSLDEYFLYQTLVGSWPIGGNEERYPDRIKNYLQKAFREGKRHTTWTEPNEAYEKAVATFVDQILQSRTFLERFRAIQEQTSFFGILNSLSQTVLKICSPGVPDFYQGTELWDLSLVDPDNRRPVNYAERKALLRNVSDGQSDRLSYTKRLLGNLTNAELKLFTIHSALQFRKAHAEIFRTGSYLPIKCTGHRAKHIVAFARRAGERTIIVAVPRFSLELPQGEKRVPTGLDLWNETTLEFEAPYSTENIFTGESLPTGSLRAGDLFRSFPAALLHF